LANSWLWVRVDLNMRWRGMSWNGYDLTGTLSMLACDKTTTTTNLFYGPLDFVWDYPPGELVPEPIWILLITEARDSEWQWHQLGHMQICTSPRQITTPAPHQSVFYKPDALPAAQPTASKHWRQQYRILQGLIKGECCKKQLNQLRRYLGS